MQVAVTGATGFVGRYLVKHLLDCQHDCRAWYRSGSNREGLPTEIEWVLGTLNDTASTQALVNGCDAVIHAALDRPGHGFRGAEGDVIEFANRNVLGTLRLIEAAKAAAVKRFIFVSTCAVHEKILEDRPLDEKHPCTPLTHYGAHKAALEMFVHSYGWGAGMPICAVRPTGVYGVSHLVENSKWYDLVRDVVAGRRVTCQRGGKEVHAFDVAQAVELLLHANHTQGECYSCYDRYISQYEVASLAKQQSKSNGIIDGESTKPKHQIENQKLCQLGMQFGGDPLLHETIAQLVMHAQQFDGTASSSQS